MAGDRVNDPRNGEYEIGLPFCTKTHVPYFCLGRSGVVNSELPLVGLKYAYITLELWLDDLPCQKSR